MRVSRLVHTSLSELLKCEHEVDVREECPQCEAEITQHICDDDCFPIEPLCE